MEPTITVYPFVYDDTNNPVIIETPVVFPTPGSSENDRSRQVWLAINVSPKSKWKVGVTGNKGVATRINDPSNDYPVGSTQFFSSTSANINASNVGDYVADISVTDGTLEGTTSFEVVTHDTN